MISGLTVFDVAEDLLEGVSAAHVILEVFIILSTLGASLYLLFRAFIKRRNLIVQAKREIASVKDDAQSWHSRAETLSTGITEAIVSQFEEWGLSTAERDIAFLLLKGLTIQEISEIRETSERTIRQQASGIYKKSGLSGRTQLSAFFLEDLFER